MLVNLDYVLFEYVDWKCIFDDLVDVNGYFEEVVIRKVSVVEFMVYC